MTEYQRFHRQNNRNFINGITKFNRPNNRNSTDETTTSAQLYLNY